ncbi:MAG TPA: PepSY domain-containing protein [Steroidobacteraceae bacterium]|nr:PepSY domain-containing protein [Steroidobacteraceae bacterium]
MKELCILGAVAMFVGAIPAVAAEHCSIHTAKGMSDAQLGSLARVSQAQAEKIAMARLAGRTAVSTVSAELEAEHGCLIWSFDLRVAGKPGVQEIQVDAGDGKVLSVKHESARQEVSEAVNEKPANSTK